MPCKSCGKDSGKFYGGSCPECLVEQLDMAEARICELEAALVDIEKHCGWLCDDIRERDKVLCHELSIRYIIAQVHPQYARAAVDGDGKREEG